jgi:AP-2 complex subunit mu-1
MYITTEGVKSAIANSPTDSSKITQQATGALSWRRSDIKYRKNEAFVDVIEDVNLLMSATGNTLRADVNGQIVMRAYLSGTPECKFGLNDRLLLDPAQVSTATTGRTNSTNNNGTGKSKARRAAAGSVTLEDCQFHQCVKLGRFDTDRIISFVPPDGEFELMRYRATENVNLPFKVRPIVREIGTTKVEYSVAIRANYDSKLFATNVVLRIPTPLNTAKTTERTSQGRAKYEPEQNNIVWKIARFSGESEYVLNAEAILTTMTHQKAWSRPPLSLSFSLLMFTSSGLLVRYLKVFEKNNYSSVKWVRYMTRAGSYEIRYVFFLSFSLVMIVLTRLLDLASDHSWHVYEGIGIPTSSVDINGLKSVSSCHYYFVQHIGCLALVGAIYIHTGFFTEDPILL